MSVPQQPRGRDGRWAEQTGDRPNVPLGVGQPQLAYQPDLSHLDKLSDEQYNARGSMVDVPQPRSAEQIIKFWMSEPRRTPRSRTLWEASRLELMRGLRARNADHLTYWEWYSGKGPDEYPGLLRSSREKAFRAEADKAVASLADPLSWATDDECEQAYQMYFDASILDLRRGVPLDIPTSTLHALDDMWRSRDGATVQQVVDGSRLMELHQFDGGTETGRFVRKPTPYHGGRSWLSREELAQVVPVR